MCIVNSTQELVGIHNLRQSTPPKSWSKYTTFDKVEVKRNARLNNNQIITYYLPVCHLEYKQYFVNTTHNTENCRIKTGPKIFVY